MPIIEIERLDKTSSDAQAKAAVSACIAQEIRNGREPDQASAICFSMVRKKTGKALAPQEGAE